MMRGGRPLFPINDPPRGQESVRNRRVGEAQRNPPQSLLGLVGSAALHPPYRSASPGLVAGRGFLLNQKNDLDGAVTALREATRPRPNDAGAYNILGWRL